MSDPAVAYDNVRKWTYADYKDWELKPGERFELIDGVAYAMSAPSTAHQAVSMVLSAEFYNYLKGKKCTVLAAPYDVRLFYEEDESDDTVVQPDLIVVCDAEKLGPEGCRGGPDLVVEILSPSNTAIEMNRKLKIYMKAGVREYWIIDPEQKCVVIYRFNGDRNGIFNVRNNDVLKTELFPGLEIPLEAIFSG